MQFCEGDKRRDYREWKGWMPPRRGLERNFFVGQVCRVLVGPGRVLHNPFPLPFESRNSTLSA